MVLLPWCLKSRNRKTTSWISGFSKRTWRPGSTGSIPMDSRGDGHPALARSEALKQRMLLLKPLVVIEGLCYRRTTCLGLTLELKSSGKHNTDVPTLLQLQGSFGKSWRKKKSHPLEDSENESILKPLRSKPYLLASLSEPFCKVNGYFLFYQFWDLHWVCFKWIYIIIRWHYKFLCLFICMTQIPLSHKMASKFHS